MVLDYSSPAVQKAFFKNIAADLSVMDLIPEYCQYLPDSFS
jgi:hypothetical protein